MTKVYSFKCPKGAPTTSKPCFIQFGKGKKKLVGEVTKKIQENTIGIPENLVLIKLTANPSASHDDIIDELKAGKINAKLRRQKEKEFFRN